MITDIIRVLQSDKFYGAGEAVEIAKGKNQYTTSFKKFKRKIVRVWLSDKK